MWSGGNIIYSIICMPLSEVVKWWASFNINLVSKMDFKKHNYTVTLLPGQEPGFHTHSVLCPGLAYLDNADLGICLGFVQQPIRT